MGEPLYSGTVQKVYRVMRQAGGLPGLDRLGRLGSLLGPALRSSEETHQYVIRTEKGQILAQSDEQFSVGDCVEVRPQGQHASGPAFRYGEAALARSERCSGTVQRMEEGARFDLGRDGSAERRHRAL